MSEPMALRLQQSGHDVLVWARRPDRARELQDADLATGTLQEVAALPALISCLRDTAAARELFLDDGPVASAPQTRLVVKHATVDPAEFREVASSLAIRGIHSVDAPVSGGPAGAAYGTLVTICGGTEDALAAARPILEATCGRIVPVGGPGAGIAVKLVNQLLVAAHSVATAEAATPYAP